MTPEEHIERAEWLISPRCDTQNPKKAAVHVAIAFFKKQHPPESGRPRPTFQRYPTGQVAVEGTDPYPSLPPDHPMNQGKTLESGNLHNHIERIPCLHTCPAYGTDSTNYARPIRDNPQA